MYRLCAVLSSCCEFYACVRLLLRARSLLLVRLRSLLLVLLRLRSPLVDDDVAFHVAVVVSAESCPLFRCSFFATRVVVQPPGAVCGRVPGNGDIVTAVCRVSKVRDYGPQTVFDALARDGVSNLNRVQ